MPEPIQEIADSRAALALLAASPERADELAHRAAFTREEMARALAGAESDDEPALKRRLRRLRARVLLRVMARDLSGRATLEEVCAAMSDLAEVSIAAVLAHLKCLDMVVVGMGKLGGRELAKIVPPFVYRKYLDYATLGAMRALHAEVRRDVARRELAGDVKLGPGGIREVEFVAQALQLIRGGRDAELTARPTLDVLSLLFRKKLLPQVAARELA